MKYCSKNEFFLQYESSNYNKADSVTNATQHSTKCNEHICQASWLFKWIIQTVALYKCCVVMGVHPVLFLCDRLCFFSSPGCVFVFQQLVFSRCVYYCQCFCGIHKLWNVKKCKNFDSVNCTVVMSCFVFLVPVKAMYLS